MFSVFEDNNSSREDRGSVLDENSEEDEDSGVLSCGERGAA